MNNPSSNNTTPPPKHHHHGAPFAPPYGIDSMNRLNPMRGRPSEGVGRELLGGVLYKLIKKNREINLIPQLILFSVNCSPTAKNGGRNDIHR
jgi:hypothetical protein